MNGHWEANLGGSAQPKKKKKKEQRGGEESDMKKRRGGGLGTGKGGPSGKSHTPNIWVEGARPLGKAGSLCPRGQRRMVCWQWVQPGDSWKQNLTRRGQNFGKKKQKPKTPKEPFPNKGAKLV